MKLSKTATLLHEVFDFPREVCKLIGIFSGHDMGLLPGQEFYRFQTLPDHQISVWDPSVLFQLEEGPYVPVSLFLLKVYIVQRVTACRAFTRQVHEYRMYTTDTGVQGCFKKGCVPANENDRRHNYIFAPTQICTWLSETVLQQMEEAVEVPFFDQVRFVHTHNQFVNGPSSRDEQAYLNWDSAQTYGPSPPRSRDDLYPNQ